MLLHALYALGLTDMALWDMEQTQYLDSAQQRDSGGVIDDAFAKDQIEQQGRSVLLQNLQDRHAVRGGEDGSQRQAVLSSIMLP